MTTLLLCINCCMFMCNNRKLGISIAVEMLLQWEVKMVWPPKLDAFVVNKYDNKRHLWRICKQADTCSMSASTRGCHIA